MAVRAHFHINRDKYTIKKDLSVGIRAHIFISVSYVFVLLYALGKHQIRTDSRIVGSSFTSRGARRRISESQRDDGNGQFVGKI